MMCMTLKEYHQILLYSVQTYTHWPAEVYPSFTLGSMEDNYISADGAEFGQKQDQSCNFFLNYVCGAMVQPITKSISEENSVDLPIALHKNYAQVHVYMYVVQYVTCT